MIDMDRMTQYAVQYGMQAVVAIGIFAAGAMASRWAGNIVQQSLERQTLEPPLQMLLVRFAQGNLWHLVWAAVVVSCLLSLLFSLLIHGQINWDYPFTAGLISLVVSSLVVSLITRLRALEHELAEAVRLHARTKSRGIRPKGPGRRVRSGSVASWTIVRRLHG